MNKIVASPRKQLLKDLLSEIDASIFDHELADKLNGFLEEEGDIDFSRLVGQVIIVPKKRHNISMTTLNTYSADLQSLQTAITAEQVPCEIIETSTEKDESTAADDMRQLDDNIEDFDALQDNLEDESSIVKEDNAEVVDQQKVSESINFDDGDMEEDDEEEDSRVDDGVEKKEPFTVSYLDPEKPEEGILYIVAEFTLEELLRVAQFEWVARLELPKEYSAELKG